MTRLTTETLLIVGISAVVFWYVDAWIGLFVALAAVSPLFFKFDVFAYMRREAILLGIAWYVVVAKLAWRRYLVNALCVVALFNSLAVILQAFKVDPYAVFSFGLMHGTSRLTGLMFNENELSCLLGVTVPFFLSRPWRWFIPVVVAALVLPRSTVGILAAAAGGIVWLICHRKEWWIAYIALAGAAYVILWDTNLMASAAVRWGFYKQALALMVSHPFGVGPGHWHLAANQLHAHSDLLQVGAEMGIPGLLVLAGYTIHHSVRHDLHHMIYFLPVIVVSLIGFPWFIATTALVNVTILGLINNSGTSGRYMFGHPNLASWHDFVEYLRGR